jgi:hypothetical protein
VNEYRAAIANQQKDQQPPVPWLENTFYVDFLESLDAVFMRGTVVTKFLSLQEVCQYAVLFTVIFIHKYIHALICYVCIRALSFQW